MKILVINFKENKIKFKSFILKSYMKFDWCTETSGNLSPFFFFLADPAELQGTFQLNAWKAVFSIRNKHCKQGSTISGFVTFSYLFLFVFFFKFCETHKRITEQKFPSLNRLYKIQFAGKFSTRRLISNLSIFSNCIGSQTKIHFHLGQTYCWLKPLIISHSRNFFT